MWVFREEEPSFGEEALPLVIGALGGLTVGLLLSRRSRVYVGGERGNGDWGSQVRQRARSAASLLRPARRHGLVGEQSELSRLEDTVLDAFLADEVLSERGIDVGAISRGTIELSGSVWTEDEADRAVHLANRLPGVQTVIDRLEIDDEEQHLATNRRRFADGEPEFTETKWEGRIVGMGHRRQGRETDPDRPDDSQRSEERALERADRDEWMEEEFAAKQPNLSERPEDLREGNRPDFAADELDNQDPHGNDGTRTLDAQPQELNTSARVGEGMKPGVELRLENADVPVKPHSSES